MHSRPTPCRPYAMDLEKGNISHCCQYWLIHNLRFTRAQPGLHTWVREALNQPSRQWPGLRRTVSGAGTATALQAFHRASGSAEGPCSTAAGLLPGTRLSDCCPAGQILTAEHPLRLLSREKFLAAARFPAHPSGAASSPSHEPSHVIPWSQHVGCCKSFPTGPHLS